MHDALSRLIAHTIVVGQSSPSVDMWFELRQWGPPGVMLALLLLGIFVPKYVLDRADKEFERVRAQRDELITQLREVVPVLTMVQRDMLPALERSTAATAAAAGYAAQVADVVPALERATTSATAMSVQMNDLKVEVAMLRRLVDEIAGRQVG